jgi:hypothetical protein
MLCLIKHIDMKPHTVKAYFLALLTSALDGSVCNATEFVKPFILEKPEIYLNLLMRTDWCTFPLHSNENK